MDVAYLRLLSDVADRSPRALWSVAGDAESLSPLFRGLGAPMSSSSRSSPEERLEAYIGALCQVGVAFETAGRRRPAAAVDAPGGGGARSEAEARARLLLAEAEFDDQRPRADVDPGSPPARLGGAFLPPALESLLLLVAHSSARRRLGPLSRCASHLSTCAERCPSLLAGDGAALAASMRACMSMARIAPNDDDEDEDEEDVASLRLSALDALATMCSVPGIRRSMAKAASSPSPRCVGEGGEDPRTQMVREESPLLRFLVRGDDGRGDCGGGGVLHLCAELAVSGVDDDEGAWSDERAAVTNDPSWEDDRVALHAESLLESFVESLGGASTLPLIFGLVDRLLLPATTPVTSSSSSPSSSSWRNRRAALSILERCLAAAPVTFAPHVPAAVDAALRSFGDPSPRVQYQALQLLGSICCADSPGGADAAHAGGGGRRHRLLVREKYGGAILEAVSRCVGSQCTKIAAHACGTIVSYCRGGNGSEDCMVPIERGLIAPYVGNLLDALRSGPLAVDLSDPNSVDGGGLTVLIRAIGAVACLADAVGEDFLPHYAIMGGLKACALFGLYGSGGIIKLKVNVKNTHEMAILRGSAIEAASIVGQAVSGPDGENVSTYVADASEIMTIAITMLDGGDADIIPIDQLLAACARIAAVMGPQYVPFMPSILPHILRKATEKLEVSITDDGDENDADDQGEDGTEGYTISIPGMGAKRVKINTTQLEEKAQMARALYEHARALGKEFGPFIEASINAFLPLVRCEYSGDVRSTSAQALCQIFKSACLSAVEGNSSRVGQAQTLLPELARDLAEQLSKENDDDDEIENRNAISDALSEIMWDAHEHRTTDGERVAQIAVADARDIVRCLMTLIQSCLVRRSTLISKSVSNSFDCDEIARCEDRALSESEFLTHLVDSVGYQSKSLGPSFGPIFEDSVAGTVSQIIASSCTISNDVRAKIAVICLLDDCVEHCGSSMANKYGPLLLEGIKDALDYERNNHDDYVELKRVAVYGLSQIARHAPNSLPLVMGHHLLTKVYNIAKEVETVPKNDIEHITLIENAVSSIAALALLRGSPLFDSLSDKSELIKVFLCGLPIEEDVDEAKVRS